MPKTRRPRPSGARGKPDPANRQRPGRSAASPRLDTVRVPAAVAPLFLKAQDYVRRYFSDRVEDPRRATIEISGERYILMRAASMSVEFLDLVTSLYQDAGPDEARDVANNLLFDLAHAIGRADARAFAQRMGVEEPIERLSAGPVHFSFAGWAFVEISPESRPSPDEDYFLIYDHPYSFESATWVRRGRRSPYPVCIMNAGYSSGWCEESFGLPLVAAEIECVAAGDEHCRFVMAPPSRIEAHLERIAPTRDTHPRPGRKPVAVPEFFQRKRMEDALRRSHESLERRVRERTRELELANERLQREVVERRKAEQMRDEFLSVASHELRAPLTSLRGFAQLLLQQIDSEGRTDPGALRQGLGAIERQTDRLSRLVTQLLDVTHIEAGHLVLDRRPTDLVALAAAAVEGAQARTERHRVRLTTSAPTANVWADAVRLDQVLVNLLDNAIKYSPDGGPIEVSVSPVGPAWQIAVSDRGLGVPAERRERLFDRYYQAHAERGLGGLGLGLYISREIVERHGGTLAIETPPGGGTRMVVSLPDGEAVP